MVVVIVCGTFIGYIATSLGISFNTAYILSLVSIKAIC